MQLFFKKENLWSYKPERLGREVRQPVRFEQKAERPEEPCMFPQAEDIKESNVS